MVGVRGKSKGCNTCRRRKKGCDLQRPICGQCQKSNLRCDGYTRDTVWVNMRAEAGAVRRYTPPSDVALPETFTRSAYHEQYLGIFWNSYLPNSRAFPPECAHFMTGVWMNQIHELFRMDGQLALRKCLLAIALATVGKRDNKQWMMETSINLYSDSLAILARKLEDRNGFTSDIGLATSRLLSLYEILHGNDQQERITQARNWHSHINGGLGFILSRGPERYTTGFGHQIFVDDRTTQISAAIASRTSSILNEPEWKTIPWRDTPKSAKDLLGDILAEIPGMMVELDEMRSAEDKSIMRDKLIEKCRHLEKEWLKWRRESAPTQDPVITSPDTISAPRVFDHQVAAHVMTLYWAVGIFIYATFHLVSRTTPSELIHDPTNPRICCQKIAEIIPTFLHPYSGDFGMHGVMFPSITSLVYLADTDGGLDSAEARAFFNVFASSSNGMKIQHFVENMRQMLIAQRMRLFEPVFQS